MTGNSITDDGTLTMESVDSRLKELESIGDGWMDGEGVPPTRSAVNAARMTLTPMEGIVPPPLITPVVDGGMEIEWDESMVEEAINADGSITCYDLSQEGDAQGMGVRAFSDPAMAATWLLKRFHNT